MGAHLRILRMGETDFLMLILNFALYFHYFKLSICVCVCVCVCIYMCVSFNFKENKNILGRKLDLVG